MVTVERADISEHSEHVEEFQVCVSDYRRSLEELREIEDRMTRTVKMMRASGAPLERLLVAREILEGVRGALRTAW